MQIRKYVSSDAVGVAGVISKTFSKFNHKEGTKEAVNRYVTNYSPRKNSAELKKQFERTSLFFVAVDKGKIVGMIRGNKNRVVNLFVLGSHHGIGLGKSLLKKFENQARKAGSKMIQMRASLYATPFYQSQGYRKTTGIRDFMGLKVQPMIKKFI